MITYTNILAVIVIIWCVLMAINFLADIVLATLTKKASIKKDNEPFVYEDDSLNIKIKYFDDELVKLEKIECGDWIDLRAAEDVGISKGEFKLIPLGIAMELPEGYEAHVVPRSSTYKNYKILQTNSMGRYTF